MRRFKSILALGAFFVVAVGLSACGSGIPGNAVVDMAGNSISTQAFDHWMYVAAKGAAAQSGGTAPVIVPTDPPAFKGCLAQVRKQIPQLAKQSDKTIQGDCKQLFTSLSGQVLDFLIKAYWYQAEFAKLHLKFTSAQLQQAFQHDKQQQFPTSAAFQTFLTQSGQTLQDIYFRVRVNEIFKKLLAKHQTTVSSAQISAYYFGHLSQFGTPETRNLRLVRTNKSSQAQAALSALKSGKGWKAVAKQYSVDTATKSNGGQLVGVAKGQEEHALDIAAFTAKPGKLVGPVHGQFGYYVIEVTKIKAATRKSLAQSTPLIKEILTGQLQTTSQAAVDKQAKKDWQTKTKCRSGYSMVDCAGYTAPKTTTTTPTPAPSSTTSSSTSTTSSK